MKKLLFLILAAVFLLGCWLYTPATATEGCDWYLQHEPSPEHPDGWGECMWFTATPTEVEREEPTSTPTVAPTIWKDDFTATPTEEQPDVVTGTYLPPRTYTPSPYTPTPSYSKTPTASCEYKCIYNQAGKPGTHNVTAWSVDGVGPFTWQVKIKGVWYDVYNCNGMPVATTVEYRDKFNESTGRIERTAITRLVVDSSAPSDAASYRVTQGANFYDFDNFSY